MLLSLVIILPSYYSLVALLDKAGWLKLSSGQIMFAGTFMIIIIIGVIFFLFSLLSKSVEERKKRDIYVRLEIRKDLELALQKFYGSMCRDRFSDIYLCVVCEKFLQGIGAKFPIADLDKNSLKPLLNGISNNLAVLYYLLDCRKTRNDDIIRTKPEGWEEEIRNNKKLSKIYIETKNSLHELYGRVEKYALKNNVEIVQDAESKMRYLLYADTSIFDYIEVKKQEKSKKGDYHV